MHRSLMRVKCCHLNQYQLINKLPINSLIVNIHAKKTLHYLKKLPLSFSFYRWRLALFSLFFFKKWYSIFINIFFIFQTFAIIFLLFLNKSLILPDKIHTMGNHPPTWGWGWGWGWGLPFYFTLALTSFPTFTNKLWLNLISCS